MWSIDSGLPETAEIINYQPTKLLYFGNCINSVQSVFGDATTMAYFISCCKVIPTNNILPIIHDGEKPLPKKLMNWIKTHQDKLEDDSEIVCGIDLHQKIAFIYITDLDIHYFFDVK